MSCGYSKELKVHNVSFDLFREEMIARILKKIGTYKDFSNNKKHAK